MSGITFDDEQNLRLSSMRAVRINEGRQSELVAFLLDHRVVKTRKSAMTLLILLFALCIIASIWLYIYERPQRPNYIQLPSGERLVPADYLAGVRSGKYQ